MILVWYVSGIRWILEEMKDLLTSRTTPVKHHLSGRFLMDSGLAFFVCLAFP